MDKKLAKDIKRFSMITNIAIAVIVTIAMGLGIGYVIDYFFETNYWIVILSIIFTFIAIINFIRSVMKVAKIDD